MSEEYYGKNLFGERVDMALAEPEEEAMLAKKKEFNIFALTDAVGARNKRSAWMIYEQALASGMVADEIFYRVVWGVKSLLLTAKCETPEEAGLNPFVYKKSKQLLSNWKAGELEKLLEELTIGYHKARRGFFNMEEFIERLILSI